jgi:Phage terminase large subunit (GpA)
MGDIFYRSELAERLLHLDGKPFSLDHYPFYRAIYDGLYQRTLLKTGRQVAKSTTLANFMISESIGQPFFKNYFIAPSQEQTRRFSHTRIGKTLTYSADVRKAFLSDSIDNVFLRILKNGAEMAFTYACDDADRARGYSADRCNFDEVQDMLYDAVIPIVEECMANSKFAYSTYCGTPKTMENTIEFLWGLSTQTEWVIKCDACSKRTFIISDKVIGKNGPECLNCRAPLNPRNAVWVDMKPGAAVKGFHISQLMLPENVPSAWTSYSDIAAAKKRWERILFKYETYGPSQFDNEVLGVSTALGTRLLSKEELEAMCDDYHMCRLPTNEILSGVTNCFAGVDWSGGSAEVKGTEGLVKSRTVLHVWGNTIDGRLKTMYYKIFPNGHATSWIDEIVEVCNSYNAKFIVCDAGEGYMATSLLREKLGGHRVHNVRYSGSTSKPIYWNPDNKAYIAGRTLMMDSYALFLKQRRAIYPRITEMTPAINDILNIYEEVTNAGNKVWRHAPTQPDDCFHAQLFGWLAWKLYAQDLTFHT